MTSAPSLVLLRMQHRDRLDAREWSSAGIGWIAHDGLSRDLLYSARTAVFFFFFVFKVVHFRKQL